VWKIVGVLPEEDGIMMNYSGQINFICLLTRIKVFGRDLWRLQQCIGFSNAYNISNAVEADKNFSWLVGKKKKPNVLLKGLWKLDHFPVIPPLRYHCYKSIFMKSYVVCESYSCLEQVSKRVICLSGLTRLFF